MRKYFLAILVVSQLACSPHVDLAKESLEDGLASKKSDVLYKNLKEYPGAVVCGEFSEFDPEEGRTKFKRFIYQAGRARTPTTTDVAIFCNSNQAEAIETQLGIGPFDSKNTHLLQIHNDLHLLASGIEQYRKRNSSIPPMQPGLTALVGQPAEDAPVLKELPQDPWGRPYVYDTNQLSFGAKRSYKLYTLGADGRPGGRNENADIGLEHLKYLDHLASLQP